MLTFVLVIGSGWVYYLCKKDRPYYHENISLLYNVTSAIYCWINISVFVCMLLRNTEFSCGIYLVSIGSPTIGIIEYYSSHPRQNYMSKNLTSFSTGMECARFLRYLTEAIHTQSDKMNSKIS